MSVPSVARPARQRGRFHAGCLLAVVLLLVAAGVGVFFLAKASMEITAEQVKRQLRDHPVVREHLGEIEGIEVNLKASSAVGERERLVLNVRGTKGTGELSLLVRVDEDVPDDATEETPLLTVVSGTLRTAAGETYDIVVEGEAVPPAATPEKTPEGATPSPPER